MAASPGPSPATVAVAGDALPPLRCPHCGAVQEEADGPSRGSAPPTAATRLLLPPPAPASQPDDAAAPGVDAVTGGVAPCTSCGFILDEGVWDGRPPLPRDRDESNAGPGGHPSGGGEGTFLAAAAGAEEAAVAAAGRTGAPALRFAQLAMTQPKHTPAFAALAEMAGIARKATCLGVARHYLRAALAVPGLAGPGRVPHRMLAASALLLAAREDAPPGGRATHVADVAAAAGVAPPVLAGAYRHFLAGVGALNPERAPGGADFLGRALARAAPLPRPPPGHVLAPGLRPPPPPGGELAARDQAAREAGALIGWAAGPAGPRVGGRPLPVPAVGAAAAVLGAAAAGLALPPAAAADAFQAAPAAVGRALGALRSALAAAAPAAPWLGSVKPGEAHLHISTLVRASLAVAARAAAAAAAAALPGGEAPAPALPAPAAPPTPVGGKKRGGGDGGTRLPPRTRARAAAEHAAHVKVEGGGRRPDGGSDDDDDDDGDIDWAEYLRSPEEVAFVRALMAGD